jgi:hypothetical protein
MFTNQELATDHFLLLIKVGQIRLVYALFHCVFQAIALFNADQHQEAMLLVKELAAACPDADLLGCCVVEVSALRRPLVINADLCNFHIRHLCTELATKASGDARHDEAANHFATAVNAGALSSKCIHLIYEDFIMVRQYDAYITLSTTEYFG